MPKSAEIVEFLSALREKDVPGKLPEGLPRAVIDTNVLMDFWRFRDPRALPLLALLEKGAFAAVRDDETENEFAEVLGRPQFGVPLAEQKRILALWHGLSHRISETLPAPFGCPDPLDQKLFDLAYSGKASLLVTKDRLVLKAGRRTRKAGLLTALPEDAPALLARQG